MKKKNNFADRETLSISSWNVHGLGQKHRDQDFLELLNNDINIFIETWKNNDSDIQIPDFQHFISCRSKKSKAKRNSGGIVIYIKNEIAKMCNLFQNHKIDCG